MKTFPICLAKLSKKTNKYFLAYNNILPCFGYDAECIQKIKNKISTKRKNLLAVLLCTKKITKQNSLNKPVYLFDDYHFCSESEVDFEDSFCSLVFNKNFDQCQHILQQYFNGKHFEIVIDTLKTKDQRLDEQYIVQSLESVDYAYLINYRVFLKIVDNNIEIRFFYPRVNYAIQQLKKFPKFVKIPLSEKLFKNMSNSKYDRVTFGYVTLDQSHRFYPLKLDQQDCLKNFPICGLWIKGLDCSIEQIQNNQQVQSLLWGLMTYLLLNTQIKIKISLLNEQQKGFVFLSFYQKGQFNGYFVKIVDRASSKVKIEQQKLKIDTDSNTNEQHIKIDFTDLCVEKLQEKQIQTQKDFNTHNSINTTSSIELKENNEEHKNSMKDSGVQVNSSSISEDNFLNFLKKQQIQNDKFYKKTIEKMQGQMELLSQAIISINQNLMLINQKVFNSQNNNQNYIQKQAPQNSMKNSSNTTEKDEQIKIQNLMPKISTQSMKTHNTNEFQNSINEDFYSSNNISEIKEIQSKNNKSCIKPDTQILSQNNPTENQSMNQESPKIEDSHKNLLTDSSQHNEQTLSKIQKVYTPSQAQKFFNSKKCEYQEHDKNNQSIPIPKINPRFIKNHDESDSSNMSDEEQKNKFEQIAKKYNN